MGNQRLLCPHLHRDLAPLQHPETSYYSQRADHVLSRHKDKTRRGRLFTSMMPGAQTQSKFIYQQCLVLTSIWYDHLDQLLSHSSSSSSTAATQYSAPALLEDMGDDTGAVGLNGNHSLNYIHAAYMKNADIS